MHQSIPPAFARLVSPGGGAFANFALPEGRAFANPGAIPEVLTSLRSWRYCVLCDFSFGGGAAIQKKGVGTRRLKYLAAPPPTLTRLVQRLRRQISLA